MSCGLSRKELLEFKIPIESQLCKAEYEDECGTRLVCNCLISKHRSEVAPTPSALDTIFNVAKEGAIRTYQNFVSSFLPLGPRRYITRTLNLEHNVSYNVNLRALRPLWLGNGRCTNLVGIEGSIGRAIQIIEESLPLETSASDRKSPLIVSRCSRGGKTTILSLIHERLRDRGVNCLSISFNGISGFTRNHDETDEQALFRMVTNQLDRTLDINEPRKVSWKEVDDYIGESPFVLIIDEINSLTSAIGTKLATALKDYFLDKANRYLVMSTHKPFLRNLEINTPTSLSTFWSESEAAVSGRLIRLLLMPESYNVQELQAMHERCRGITRSWASFYGGIPALMYAVLLHPEVERPGHRFKTIVSADQSYGKDLFVDFVVSLVTGTFPPSLRPFSCFLSDARLGEGNLGTLIKWPLCYVLCIMELFQISVAVDIVNCIQALLHDTATVGDGMVWEQSVKMAILLRFVLASSRADFGVPFNLCSNEEAKDAEIVVSALGVGVRTVTQARDVIFATADNLRGRKALILFYPTEATFQQFDGFCMSLTANGTVRIAAYQCKQSNQGASGRVPVWIDRFGHLFRSIAPHQCCNFGPSSDGWVYYNREDTDRFLGWSLRIFR